MMMIDRYSDKLKALWYGTENNTNFPGHNFQYDESWKILQYTISAIYLKATGNHWMVSSIKTV